MDEQELLGLAKSQLDHILLALQAGDRGFNLRNFVDTWWSFDRGGAFVSRKRNGGLGAVWFNNPCPWTNRSALRQFDWLSEGADAILRKGEAARIVDRKNHSPEFRLIIEHSVPIAVISRHLWSEPEAWNREQLQELFEKNLKRAVLSKTEDQRINDAGLRSKMPANWHFGDDPFARYREADIAKAPTP